MCIARPTQGQKEKGNKLIRKTRGKKSLAPTKNTNKKTQKKQEGRSKNADRKVCKTSSKITEVVIM